MCTYLEPDRKCRKLHNAEARLTVIAWNFYLSDALSSWICLGGYVHMCVYFRERINVENIMWLPRLCVPKGRKRTWWRAGAESLREVGGKSFVTSVTRKRLTKLMTYKCARSSLKSTFVFFAAPESDVYLHSEWSTANAFCTRFAWFTRVKPIEIPPGI